MQLDLPTYPKIWRHIWMLPFQYCCFHKSWHFGEQFLYSRIDMVSSKLSKLNSRLTGHPHSNIYWKQNLKRPFYSRFFNFSISLNLLDFCNDNHLLKAVFSTRMNDNSETPHRPKRWGGPVVIWRALSAPRGPNRVNWYPPYPPPPASLQLET